MRCPRWGWCARWGRMWHRLGGGWRPAVGGVEDGRGPGAGGKGGGATARDPGDPGPVPVPEPRAGPRGVSPNREPGGGGAAAGGRGTPRGGGGFEHLGHGRDRSGVRAV